mgnify:CR=1 FL=1
MVNAAMMSAKLNDAKMPVVTVVAPQLGDTGWMTYAMKELAPRVGVRFRLVWHPLEVIAGGAACDAVLWYSPDLAPAPELAQAAVPVMAMWCAHPSGQAMLRNEGRLEDERGAPWYAVCPGAPAVVERGSRGACTVHADLFAMAWALLSRREETTMAVVDAHGRVPAAPCWQVQAGDVGRPVVDEAARSLAALLGEVLPPENQPKPLTPWGGEVTAGGNAHGLPFAVCLTHDLDSIRKFQGFRATMGSLRREAALHPGRWLSQATSSMVKGDPHWQALAGLCTPEWIGEQRPTFFVVTGGNHPLDPPYTLDPKALEGLRIIPHAAGAPQACIGLHPSYNAGRHPAQLREQIEAFQEVFGTAPQIARIHYLRWDPLRTPRMLAESGFRVDSTLGWSDRPGFRAGTCLPFALAHPLRNEALPILEIPLVVMDTTLCLHQQLTVDAALDATRQLALAVQKVGGVLTVLQHPHLACDAPQDNWHRWWTVLVQELQATPGAQFMTLSEVAERWESGLNDYAMMDQ